MKSIIAVEINDYLLSFKKTYSNSHYEHTVSYLKDFDKWIIENNIVKLHIKNPEVLYYNSSRFPLRKNEKVTRLGLLSHLFRRLDEKYKTIADIVNENDEVLESLY